MARKRKNKHQQEHVDEAWLLPYSDMLTLLLALFIVMFAMSQIDKDKLQKMSESFNQAFAGGSGLLEKDGSSVIKDMAPTGEVVEQDKMISAKQQLEQEIKNSGYEGKINVGLNGEGLSLTMQDSVLFKSGYAEILSDFNPALVQISKIIKDFNNDIRIAGHTDNVPINNSKFNSNWDLSYTRSLKVMEFMVNQGKIDANKFSIQAYGEHKPKFDNSTQDGKDKNRRVEILVVRNHPVDDKKAK